jgi:hypothetical protein
MGTAGQIVVFIRFLWLRGFGGLGTAAIGR